MGDSVAGAPRTPQLDQPDVCMIAIINYLAVFSSLTFIHGNVGVDTA